MRAFLILIPLLLGSCGRGDEPADQAADGSVDGVSITAQWGAGRDRMCIKNQRAGLIVYAAEGNTNCMVRGTSEAMSGGFRIRPDGDETCAIPVRMENGVAILGEQSPACAYYCGPKASFAGKRLESTTQSPAVDLAGDPLC